MCGNPSVLLLFRCYSNTVQADTRRTERMRSCQLDSRWPPPEQKKLETRGWRSWAMSERSTTSSCGCPFLKQRHMLFHPIPFPNKKTLGLMQCRQGGAGKSRRA